MENEVQDILIGTVEDISFYNDNTGFCVAEVNTGDEGVTVVGTVGELAVGAEIECRGIWSFHPSFGRQFKAETVVQTLPAEAAYQKHIPVQYHIPPASDNLTVPWSPHLQRWSSSQVA